MRVSQMNYLWLCLPEPWKTGFYRAVDHQHSPWIKSSRHIASKEYTVTQLQIAQPSILLISNSYLFYAVSIS